MDRNYKMKVLVLYDYPPSPAGLATQGNLMHKRKLGRTQL